MTRKQITIILLVLVSIASSIYVFVVTRKPETKSPIASEPIVSSDTELAKAQYQGVTTGPQLVAPEVPKEFSIFSASTQPVSLVNISSQLARQFNIPASKTVGVWSNDSTGEFLSISSDATILVYNISSYVRPDLYSGAARPQLEAATQAAKDFIGSIESLKSLPLEVGSVGFLRQDSEDLSPVSESAAEIIKFTFVQRINGISVFVADQTKVPVTVWVGQKNTVVKFEATSPVVQYAQNATLALSVSFSDAVEQVKQGSATIIDIQGEAALQQDLTKLTKLALNSVVLEYRLNRSSGQLLPYYKFLATMTNNAGTITVYLLVPASKN